MACLPNRYSYTELYHRARNGPAHERLYTISEAQRKLERHGFDVIFERRYFMLPTMLNGLPERLRDAYQRKERLVWSVNDALEQVWPVNWLASNLMLVGRKRP